MGVPVGILSLLSNEPKDNTAEKADFPLNHVDLNVLNHPIFKERSAPSATGNLLLIETFILWMQKLRAILIFRN
jgi:hypothetical protein